MISNAMELQPLSGKSGKMSIKKEVLNKMLPPVAVCTVSFEGVILAGNSHFQTLDKRLKSGGHSRFLGSLLSSSVTVDSLLESMTREQRVEITGLELVGTTDSEYFDMVCIPAEEPFNHQYFVVYLFPANSPKSTVDQENNIKRADLLRSMVSGTFHDYNNILSIITGYCQLILMDNPADEKQKDMLQTILKAADRASDVSKRILYLNHYHRETPDTINLSLLVEENVRTLKRLIGEDIIVKMTVVEKNAFVYISRSDIVMILTGLAMHARNLMTNGGVIEIEISSENITSEMKPELEPGLFHKLIITKFGLDQPDMGREFLYAPLFLQGDGEAESHISVAHLFNEIKSYGAHAEVHEFDDGSLSCVLYFQAKNSTDQHDIQNASTPTLIKGKGELVLVVEDDPHVHSLVRHVLRKCDYNVIDAMNAGEAKLLIENYNYHPDLMICDIVLPLMNGVELASEMSRSLPDMKIIFMTGYPKDKLPETNTNHYQLIQKPVLPYDLSKSIRQILDIK